MRDRSLHFTPVCKSEGKNYESRHSITAMQLKSLACDGFTRLTDQPQKIFRLIIMKQVFLKFIKRSSEFTFVVFCQSEASLVLFMRGIQALQQLLSVEEFRYLRFIFSLNWVFHTVLNSRMKDKGDGFLLSTHLTSEAFSLRIWGVQIQLHLNVKLKQRSPSDVFSFTFVFVLVATWFNLSRYFTSWYPLLPTPFLLFFF